MVLRHHLLALYTVFFILYIGPIFIWGMKNTHVIALPLDAFLYFSQNRFGFIGLPTA